MIRIVIVSFFRCRTVLLNRALLLQGKGITEGRNYWKTAHCE
jgi:hypothetical protein